MILILGLLLVGGALVAMCFSLGIVQTTDSTTRARLLGDDRQRVKGKQESTASRLRVEAPEEVARLVIARGHRAKIERNLMLAGYPSGWTWQKIILVKGIAPAVALVALYKFAFSEFSLLKTGGGLAVVVVAYFVPDLVLSSRARERQSQMELQLPDALDKVVIAIESGLSFEAALLRAAQTGGGAFADELMRTIQDIRLGMPRRAAYEALAGRTESEDIHRFVRSVIQAAETGVSVSTIVRSQSEMMRMKRKLRAEGKAQQVSTKLLFPLLVCVFPVLFVVVLAPAIMNTVAMFKAN